jgi:hypothetical protein
VVLNMDNSSSPRISGVFPVQMTGGTTIQGGTLTIPSSQAMQLINSTITDAVTVGTGGTLTTLGTTALNGPLTVQSSGTLIVRGQNTGFNASLTITNSFTNSGVIDLTTSDAGYSVTLNVAGGTGTLTNASGATLQTGFGAGGTRTFGANVVNNGTFTIAPSSNVQAVSISGNYTQGSTGSLNMEIGGPSSYDQLNVTGSATLAGTLGLTLINAYNPNGLCQVNFTVMNFASRTGTMTISATGVWNQNPTATTYVVCLQD